MKPGVLLIRADANVAIGTGHVMRCLALAQAWQDVGGQVYFVAAELPDPLAPRLSANGFSLLRVAAAAGSRADALALIAQAQRLAADWVVVDGDGFGVDFLGRLREASLRVLLIDDFADRERFPAELIVNPNLGVDGDRYQQRGAIRPALTGPRYFFLRREFQQAYQRRFEENGKRVLVTLGGSDPENLTPRIAQALMACPDLELTVVAGAGYSKVGELRDLTRKNCKIVVDAQNMAELMRNADLAIIAAGGTLWELLSVGCVVLSYARNSVQMRVIQSLANDGVVVNLGDTANFAPEALIGAVMSLVNSCSDRERMARGGRAVIDGGGTSRVVDTLRKMGAR